MRWDGSTYQHLLVNTVVVVRVEVVAVQVILSVLDSARPCSSLFSMQCDAMRRTPRCGACWAQP